MDHLREYDSSETLPKRRLPKSRKPYAVEYRSEWEKMMGRPEWIVTSRYATLERAQQALAMLIKHDRFNDATSSYRLQPPQPEAEGEG